MTDTHKGLLSLYLAISLLAGMGLFAKMIEASALDIIAFRSWIALLTLGLVILVTKHSFRMRSGRDYLVVGLLGILLGTHWITFFHAMRISTVVVGMTALYTYPVITVFIEALFRGKQLQRGDVLCSIVVFAGIYIMAPINELDGNIFMGAAWGVFSAVLFALRNVVQRQFLSGYSSQVVIFYQVLVTALMLLPFVESDVRTISPDSLWSLLLLGSVFTAVPHTLIATSLRYLKAKTVGFIGCLQPVLGAMLAAFVLGEALNFTTVLGAALVLAAASYESILTRKQKPLIPPYSTRTPL